MKRELATVIDELLASELSPGRRYEKLDAADDLYSVRLSRGYRFVFLLPEIIPRLVYLALRTPPMPERLLKLNLA